MNRAQRQAPPIYRGDYVERVKRAASESSVTVLTGVRRGGKTFILKELITELKAGGVDDEHIIYLDFEKFVFPRAAARKELKQYLENRLQISENADQAAERFYVFLDEAEVISGWEKTITPFLSRGDVSVFAAVSGTAFGKNGKKKTSPEKWREIAVTPLSYAEYWSLDSSEVPQTAGLLKKAITVKQLALKLFDGYLREGGFPATVGAANAERQSTLSDIYSAIIYHDVIARYDIKNARLPEMIIKYVFERLGEECSAGKLIEHFKQMKYTKNLSAVPAIVRFLETAFIIIRVRRINLASMKAQTARSRYFAADHALFHAMRDSGLDTQSPASRGILTNIIVSELRRRGYEVYSGVINNHDVDLAALNDERVLCIQTFFERADGTTDADIQVEKYAALEEARKSISGSRKLLQFAIYFDEVPPSADAAVHGINLPDFLLSREY